MPGHDSGYAQSSLNYFLERVMGDKTANDKAHELLIELAKSDALWLNYFETTKASDLAMGLTHGNYLAEVIRKVHEAYRSADTKPY